jgi:hypothetical protein
MGDYNPKFNYNKYTVNTEKLRDKMIAIHLNFLHNSQLDMIDSAVEKSDWNESRTVINHIMQK